MSVGFDCLCDKCGELGRVGHCPRTNKLLKALERNDSAESKPVETSAAAEAGIQQLKPKMPSLQQYVSWALEPENGSRSHMEIYDYFARHFGR